MTDTKRTSDPTHMSDPPRWMDEGSASLLGALSRAGAEERPSATAKQRARAAVLLVAGGGAAAAVTKAAAAATSGAAGTGAAGTSAPLAAVTSANAGTSAAASSGAVSASTTTLIGATTSGGVGTAANVVTGAAGLSAKFGVASAAVGLSAKWMGVSAVVAALGFGGYQWASSNQATARGADAAQPAATAGIDSRTLSNKSGVAMASAQHAPVTNDDPVPATPTLEAVSPQAPWRLGFSREQPPSLVVAVDEQAWAPRRSTSGPSGGKETLPTSLAVNRELALVDRAWAALRAGKPREALRLIDDYSWTAAERQFETEALLIRLDALDQSGQQKAARSLARQVLETHKRGRLADEARRVLAEH